MKALEVHVQGQLIESWIFIITGMLSIALALFFFIIIKYSFFKGLGSICLVSGIIETGAGIFTRFTCKQTHFKIHANGTVTDDSLFYITEQLSHIQLFLCISLAAALAGISLYSLFYRSSQTFWKGIGLGLIIQGLMLSGLFEMKHRGFKNYKAMVTQPTTKAY